MRRFIAALSVPIVFLCMFGNASAHPGRTASDGCHYCKTNCAKWGVPAGARHCHYKDDAEPDLLSSVTAPTDAIDIDRAFALKTSNQER
jgi:hypothetical protein